MSFLLYILLLFFIFIGIAIFKIISYFRKAFKPFKNINSNFQQHFNNESNNSHNHYSSEEVIFSDGKSTVVLKGDAKSKSNMDNPENINDKKANYNVDLNFNKNYSSINSQEKNKNNQENIYSFFD